MKSEFKVGDRVVLTEDRKRAFDYDSISDIWRHTTDGVKTIAHHSNGTDLYYLYWYPSQAHNKRYLKLITKKIIVIKR